MEIKELVDELNPHLATLPVYVTISLCDPADDIARKHRFCIKDIQYSKHDDELWDCNAGMAIEISVYQNESLKSHS